MHYSKRLGALFLASLGLLASRRGAADPAVTGVDPQSESSHLADDKALLTFKEGIAAFDRRDFEGARVAFLQTLALKPTAPVVRRNLGLAEIYSGHYLEGARRLARVLHTTGEGTAEDRAHMVESLKKAEAYLERLTIEVNEEGAEVVIDGVDLGPSPVPFVWYVAPGPYELHVDKAGFRDFRESRQAHAGGSQHLRILLAPAPSSAPATTHSGLAPARLRMEKHPSGWILASGGLLTAAGVVAGIAFSSSASKQGDKAKQLTRHLQGTSCRPPSEPDCTELARALQLRDRQWRIATVSFIGAGVSGLVTLMYGLFGGDYAPVEPEEEALPASKPALWAGGVDGHGAYASWQTAF